MPAAELTVLGIELAECQRVSGSSHPKGQSRWSGTVNTAVVGALAQIGRRQVLLAHQESVAGAVGDCEQPDPRPVKVVDMEGAGIISYGAGIRVIVSANHGVVVARPGEI